MKIFFPMQAAAWAVLEHGALPVGQTMLHVWLTRQKGKISNKTL